MVDAENGTVNRTLDLIGIHGHGDTKGINTAYGVSQLILRLFDGGNVSTFRAVSVFSIASVSAT